ncbi:F-box domain-containing protein [Mycena venus]|uniref:F-box domain-containing protein n=1 Tax=Mycena venus TaxID=2733690 RepID=A0A8H7CL74_9AGAR|nr:F-box domain-containing protein [Mycena venus]
MSTADLRRQLTQIEAAISQQKSALASLERDKEALQRQLYAASNFPVLTLPVEITTKIFSQCLPDVEYLRSCFSQVKLQAPMVLTGVCRAWRDITLTTPALWAALYLPLNLMNPAFVTETGRVEEFIDKWINRAGLYPLSLIFYTREGPNFEKEAKNPIGPIRLREIIHRYAHRVQYLELGMPQDHIRQLGLDSCSFPLLQEAALGDSRGDRNPQIPFRVYGNAPQLRELCLLSDTVLSSYTTPCLQLTKFEGEIDTLELFTLAPNLIEAQCFLLDLSFVPASAILHSRLESLTFSAPWGYENPANPLPHLTLPALRSLSFGQLEESPVQSLYSFLTRSSPPLRTLSVDVYRERDAFPAWESCFSCVGATLENLELMFANSEFHTGIFHLDSQTMEKDSPSCLPRLRTLNILESQVGLDFWALVHFLYKRSTTSSFAKIRSFRFTSSEHFFPSDRFSAGASGEYHEDEATNHLANLASKGIDIRIESMHKAHVNHVQYVPGDEAYDAPRT